jgi:hypothetical protein
MDKLSPTPDQLAEIERDRVAIEQIKRYGDALVQLARTWRVRVLTSSVLIALVIAGTAPKRWHPGP